MSSNITVIAKFIELGQPLICQSLTMIIAAYARDEWYVLRDVLLAANGLKYTEGNYRNGGIYLEATLRVCHDPRDRDGLMFGIVGCHEGTYVMRPYYRSPYTRNSIAHNVWARASRQDVTSAESIRLHQFFEDTLIERYTLAIDEK
jgi:hypothetical protein